MGRVDQLPELRVSGQLLVFRKGKLGAKSKILKGIFVEDAVDNQAGGLLFKIDALFAGSVSVKGAVRPFDGSESVGVAGQEVGSQDVKFPQDLDLKGGGQLADLRGTRRGEDNLKGRHAG